MRVPRREGLVFNGVRAPWLGAHTRSNTCLLFAQLDETHVTSPGRHV